MSAKSGVKCGDCPDGWANDGDKKCKKAGDCMNRRARVCVFVCLFSIV